MSDLGMNLLTNDIQLQNNDLYLVTGSDAIAQDLQQSLQVWLGEWFLDTTVGVPYLQQILVKNPNLDLIHADLVNAALAVDGVEQITSLTFEFDSVNRNLSVNFQGIDSMNETLSVQTSVGALTNATIEGTPF
jgi:hypothetical protein